MSTITDLSKTILGQRIPKLIDRKECLRQLRIALQTAHDKHAPLALFFIDIDRFQIINTTLGHDIAYQVLEEVALRISNTLKEGPPIAHLGRDDFCFFLADFRSTDYLRTVANRLMHAIRAPILVDNQELLITVSVGISTFPDKTTNPEELIHQASFAVHKAQQVGGDTSRVFTRRTQIDSLKKLNLEIELRKAINRNEIELHYQPKMDLSNGRITALEALVRWNHTEFGQVSPQEFIPVAEETGLISQLGEMVLETAATDAARWHAQGVPLSSIAVNLSGQQLARQDMVSVIKRIIKKTGVPPQMLVLELTESMLIEALNTTFDVLIKLRSMGIKIAIDDFGTGYSSFQMLKSFPADIVKIDQLFICNLENNEVDLAITRSIIEIAHSLNIQVIAEGVENAIHVEILQQLGCDSIQGFYISRALPKLEIDRLLFDHYKAQQLSLLL